MGKSSPLTQKWEKDPAHSDASHTTCLRSVISKVFEYLLRVRLLDELIGDNRLAAN